MHVSTPERVLQRLDWQVIRRLDGLLQGDYRSLFYGYGIDFADLREYQPEDDIRYIDWNVTARMDTPYVRQYVEDREITAWFLLDLSPSIDFGTVENLKRTVLIDFVTTFARLLTRHGNRVGAIFYGRRIERTIPAKGGRNQVLRIVNDLLKQPSLPSAPFTNLTPLIEGGLHAIKQRSLVFILSDFICVPGWERPLSLLNQRHEVLAIRLWDPREVILPDMGLIVMEDAETGEQVYVDTHDKGFRQRFEQAGRRREAELNQTFKHAGVDVLPLSTEEDLGSLYRALRHDAAAAEKVIVELPMSFIWPAMLLLLVLIPLFVWLYFRMQQQRRRLAASAGSLGMMQGAVGRKPGLRRHIPPLFFLASLTILILALARPQTVVSLPRIEGTVILAFDVSGSMAADDMQPTRMEAAKAAVEDFVQRQPPTVQIGVVAFSDSGLSVQTPTNDQGEVLAAIKRLAPERGTSLGNGILISLDTIAAVGGQPTNYYSNLTPTPAPTATPVPAGTYTSGVIILLTDGENNQRPDPLDAAKAAADRGVRIYTVGIGSAAGTNLHINGFTVHTQLDEALLQQISQMTNGTYYNAQTEQDLRTIYDNLSPELVIKPQEMEVTPILAGMSILVLLIGGMISLLWFGRMP